LNTWAHPQYFIRMDFLLRFGSQSFGRSLQWQVYFVKPISLTSRIRVPLFGGIFLLQLYIKSEWLFRHQTPFKTGESFLFKYFFAVLISSGSGIFSSASRIFISRSSKGYLPVSAFKFGLSLHLYFSLAKSQLPAGKAACILSHMAKQ